MKNERLQKQYYESIEPSKKRMLLEKKKAGKDYCEFILLPEKFLPFDWLRAEVSQLNLKYLHVKITVTMVIQNRQIISSHELRKNGGKISRF